MFCERARLRSYHKRPVMSGASRAAEKLDFEVCRDLSPAQRQQNQRGLQPLRNACGEFRAKTGLFSATCSAPANSPSRKFRKNGPFSAACLAPEVSSSAIGCLSVPFVNDPISGGLHERLSPKKSRLSSPSFLRKSILTKDAFSLQEILLEAVTETPFLMSPFSRFPHRSTRTVLSIASQGRGATWL
jgi:hypothetical protein